MDITGDGIPDLLVCDGNNIYIFKGGNDFATFPLSKKTAYYTIQSPRLLDGKYSSLQDFGKYMYACGDMTGSGIPYLSVWADINLPGSYTKFEFFYAGGKALDSLYDAVIHYNSSFDGPKFNDTLHSINSTGRTAGLLNDWQLNANELLLFRNCDKIPHKTNPNMGVKTSVAQVSCTLRAQAGGGFVRIIVEGESFGTNAFHIYNMLGQEVDKRDIGPIIGKNIELFTTSNLADGTYLAVLQSDQTQVVIKFPVNRVMKEQAPESPVLLEMNEPIPDVMR